MALPQALALQTFFNKMLSAVVKVVSSKAKALFYLTYARLRTRLLL